MTDFFNVKAMRTFAFGNELKTRKSPTFSVEAGEARQLEAHGLVSLTDEGEAQVEVLVDGAPETGTKSKQKAKADGSNDKDA